MVIIYHLFCWVYNPIGMLNIGYIGVDIFLFFSGMGLSYSYQKNNIKEFYKRRIKKIYPLYFIVSILIILITTSSYFPLSDFIIKSLLQITTLSYYVAPEESIDWYLNSLFIFYLLFPVFYSLSKKYGIWWYLSSIILVTALLISTSVFANQPMHWKYNCFISRIPIFCLGIIFATHEITNKTIKKFAIWNLLPIIPLYFVSPFLCFSFLTPLLIIIFSKLSTIYKSSKLEYLGNHTLELYCANLIPYAILPFIESVFTKLAIFVITQLIMSILFIYINRVIQNKLSKV